MTLQATVKYNDDGEPYNLTVNERNGHTVSFALRGTSAIVRSIEPPRGEEEVYADHLSRIMDYAEELPQVQAVKLQEFEPPEEEQ